MIRRRARELVEASDHGFPNRLWSGQEIEVKKQRGRQLRRSKKAPVLEPGLLGLLAGDAVSQSIHEVNESRRRTLAWRGKAYPAAIAAQATWYDTGRVCKSTAHSAIEVAQLGTGPGAAGPSRSFALDHCSQESQSRAQGPCGVEDLH